MITTASDEKWFDEFIAELRMRDVLGHAIGDAVASARELVADSGQSAEEAFGAARTYAASLELPRETEKGWAQRGQWSQALGFLAFLTFMQASLAFLRNDPLLVGLVQLAVVAAALVFFAALPLVMKAAVRRLWLVVVLPVGIGVLTSLSFVVTPTAPAAAVLVLDPLPSFVGSAVAMVVVSFWGTVNTLRRGKVDDIISPLPGQVPNHNRARRAFVMLTNWFLPIIAAFGFALFSLVMR